MQLTENPAKCIGFAPYIFGKYFMDEIEIIKGHDCGSYFWIMPAKILDYTITTDYIHNIDELSSEEISIEEDIILDFLSIYLKANFDPSLEENIKREEFQENEFQWNQANYYTFNGVEKIITKIQKDIQKIESNTFDDDFRIKSMGGYLYYYLDKKFSEDRKEIFWKYKDIVVEFYKRFVSYMKNMMVAAQNNGYELIMFMGP